MPELFHAIQATFEKMGWQFQVVPGREVIEAGFEAYHTKVNLHVQVFGEAGVVSVVSQASLERAEAPLLRVIAELLMRTNKQLTMGGFEMDWDGGEVLFRVSNVFMPGMFSGKIMASMVHTTVSEMDRITPYVKTIERAPAEDLEEFDVPGLMGRADLLPVVESPVPKTDDGA